MRRISPFVGEYARVRAGGTGRHVSMRLQFLFMASWGGTRPILLPTSNSHKVPLSRTQVPTPQNRMLTL